MLGRYPDFLAFISTLTICGCASPAGDNIAEIRGSNSSEESKIGLLKVGLTYDKLTRILGNPKAILTVPGKSYKKAYWNIKINKDKKLPSFFCVDNCINDHSTVVVTLDNDERLVRYDVISEEIVD